MVEHVQEPGPRGWEVSGVHHVAFAHGSGTEIVEMFRLLLGLDVSHEEVAPGFVERMIPSPNGCHVQLLESAGDGVVERFVKRAGNALHHVAFVVSDIDAAVTDLVERGVHMVDRAPRSGGSGTRIAFVHPSQFSGLLVELVEEG